MGIIKFEVDIPDFEKELNINIVLKKDGEVVESISSPSSEKVVSKSRDTKKNIVEKPEPIVAPVQGSFMGNGNMMNIDF
ncbi:MAG: hypothetical protein IJ880_15330 [Bacilli bacterium]|nr:hypothetical protein [Bacilli bacterium]